MELRALHKLLGYDLEGHGALHAGPHLVAEVHLASEDLGGLRRARLRYLPVLDGVAPLVAALQSITAFSENAQATLRDRLSMLWPWAAWAGTGALPGPAAGTSLSPGRPPAGSR